MRCSKSHSLLAAELSWVLASAFYLDTRAKPAFFPPKEIKLETKQNKTKTGPGHTDFLLLALPHVMYTSMLCFCPHEKRSPENHTGLFCLFVFVILYTDVSQGPDQAGGGGGDPRRKEGKRPVPALFSYLVTFPLFSCFPELHLAPTWNRTPQVSNPVTATYRAERPWGGHFASLSF